MGEFLCGSASQSRRGKGAEMAGVAEGGGRLENAEGTKHGRWENWGITRLSPHFPHFNCDDLHRRRGFDYFLAYSGEFGEVFVEAGAEIEGGAVVGGFVGPHAAG